MNPIKKFMDKIHKPKLHKCKKKIVKKYLYKGEDE